MKSILTDNRGVAVIELAIVAPIICLLIIGVADIGMAFYSKLGLKQAAVQATSLAARKGAAIPEIDSVRAKAAELAGVSASAVNVDYWAECDGAKASTFDTACDADQQIARYVSVRIHRYYVPLFRYGPFGGSDNQGVNLSGGASVRLQ